MTNVSSKPPIDVRIFNNILKRPSANKFVKWTAIATASTAAAAAFPVLTNNLKDAFNCVCYTYQSYHNKKIPADKRKFVAALDFINGIFNVVIGTILGFTLATDWCRDKIYNLLFGNKIKALKATLEKTFAGNKEKFDKNFGKIIENSKGGLKIMIGLIATTIIAKRMVTPFLSTPIAGWFKNKYMEKKPAGSGDEFHYVSPYQLGLLNQSGPANNAVDLFNKIRIEHAKAPQNTAK